MVLVVALVLLAIILAFLFYDVPVDCMPRVVFPGEPITPRSSDFEQLMIRLFGRKCVTF